MPRTCCCSALARRVAGVIRAGIDAGFFGPRDVDAAAGAVLNATLPFHHPHFLRDPATRAADA